MIPKVTIGMFHDGKVGYDIRLIGSDKKSVPQEQLGEIVFKIVHDGRFHDVRIWPDVEKMEVRREEVLLGKSFLSYQMRVSYILTKPVWSPLLPPGTGIIVFIDEKPWPVFDCSKILFKLGGPVAEKMLPKTLPPLLLLWKNYGATEADALKFIATSKELWVIAHQDCIEHEVLKV
ncbi:MAG: hypothetical protein ABID54_03070 [Pseudomonadota bacterium]